MPDPAKAAAAHTSWANTTDRSKRTAPAREALEQKWLEMADGDPVRAESYRRAHYAKMAAKSAKVRAARKAGDDEAARPPLRTTWRRLVLRTHAITDATRVVLLVLADEMRQDGYVSVPRKDIAARLGRSERRVQQRIADAREAGLLTVIRPGYRGHTAEYRAVLPDERVTVSSTLSRAGFRHPFSGEWVPPGGPTTTRANLSLDGSAPDESSDGEMDGLRLANPSQSSPSIEDLVDVLADSLHIDAQPNAQGGSS